MYRPAKLGVRYNSTFLDILRGQCHNNSMKQGRNSQLLPVILIVIIIVVSVAAIVALVRTFILNSGEANQDTVQQLNVDEEALLSTSADRGVRMSVRGEITADEKFRSYQIVVTPSARSMTTYEGYLDKPLDTVSLDNNTKAYEEFVYALNRAGMIVGEPLKGEADDMRGLCYNGKILVFETIQNDQSVKRLWTTTCKKQAPGSLEANDSQLSAMFLEQIPQGQELIKNINKR